MNKIALNLIAIAVFSLTLSALLGPLLNISPLVPTITTVGILGLTAVDTFTFQSKGITLLLDSLLPFEHRRRIIHHEAGHFLVAYLLGIPIASYSLTAWEAFKHKQPGLGAVIVDISSLQEALLNHGEKQLIIERLCKVWMAGIAAEKMVYGDTSGGEDDLQKVRSLILSSGIYSQSYQQKENWFLLQSNNLIKRNQSSYYALVEAIQKRSSVQECYQIIADKIKEEPCE